MIVLSKCLRHWAHDASWLTRWREEESNGKGDKIDRMLEI